MRGDAHIGLDSMGTSRFRPRPLCVYIKQMSSSSIHLTDQSTFTPSPLSTTAHPLFSPLDKPAMSTLFSYPLTLPFTLVSSPPTYGSIH